MCVYIYIYIYIYREREREREREESSNVNPYFIVNVRTTKIVPRDNLKRATKFFFFFGTTKFIEKKPKNGKLARH